MKNLIGYFEGAAKELNDLINEPTGGVAQMAAVLQANARMVGKHLPVTHLQADDTEREVELEPKLPEDAPEKEEELKQEEDYGA